jgi:hypothetical protein
VNNAEPLSPMKALALLSMLQSADIVLPTTDGREIRLRRVTEPGCRAEVAPAATRPQPAGTLSTESKM